MSSVKKPWAEQPRWAQTIAIVVFILLGLVTLLVLSGAVGLVYLAVREVWRWALNG